MDKKILEHVIQTAKRAGDAALKFYNEGFEVSEKEDKSYVTSADHEANRIIFEEFSRYGYGFLSEESEDDMSRLEKQRAWIVDPLDGTRDFVEKTDDFSVLIALTEKKGEVFEPVLGVVCVPARDEIFYASRGEGAFLLKNDEVEKLRVSDSSDFKNFRMVGSRFHEAELERSLVENLGLKGRVVSGSVGLKATLIGAAKAELVVNPSSKTWEWDICAADLIVSEAGGILTDIDGNRYGYNKKQPSNLRGYVASNGTRHEEIIDEIHKIRGDKIE